MPETQITIAASQNAGLALTFNQFRGQLRTAAHENVLAATQGQGYTQAELAAMELGEQLKLTNGMELATILTRYAIIQEIRSGAHHLNHPGQYRTMEEMGRAMGISSSEMSDLTIMVEIVFPYIEQTLGIPVAQIWDEIGKSNFRELTPVLRVIITGQPSQQSENVNVVAARIQGDAAATLISSGQPHEPADVARAAVDELLEIGALPNREMRIRTAATRTPPIAPSVIRNGNGRLIVMQVSEDQWTMVSNKMRGYMDAINLEMPADRTARQRAALGVTAVRDLINLVEG